MSGSVCQRSVYRHGQSCEAVYFDQHLVLLRDRPLNLSDVQSTGRTRSAFDLDGLHRDLPPSGAGEEALLPDGRVMGEDEGRRGAEERDGGSGGERGRTMGQPAAQQASGCVTETHWDGAWRGRDKGKMRSRRTAAGPDGIRARGNFSGFRPDALPVPFAFVSPPDLLLPWPARSRPHRPHSIASALANATLSQPMRATDPS